MESVQFTFGYATTNSAIESFNAGIKRDFTFRQKLSVINFFHKCLEIFKYYSLAGKDYKQAPIPTKRCITYAKKITNCVNFKNI